MERAPDPILIAGGGIQLGPNASHAFDRLGVGDAAHLPPSHRAGRRTGPGR